VVHVVVVGLVVVVVATTVQYKCNTRQRQINAFITRKQYGEATSKVVVLQWEHLAHSTTDGVLGLYSKLSSGVRAKRAGVIMFGLGHGVPSKQQVIFGTSASLNIRFWEVGYTLSSQRGTEKDSRCGYFGHRAPSTRVEMGFWNNALSSCPHTRIHSEWKQLCSDDFT